MKHMEEMKIAGLAMALCIVMLGIYIVVPKDGNISHLTAIPDNNAAEPVPDSTSQGSVDADSDSADFPIYTEDSYYSGSDDSDDNTDTGDQIPETTEITIRDILLMTGTLMTLLIQILHREMIPPIMILVMLLMMVRIPVTILIRNWMTVVPEIPEMIP